MTDPGGFVTVEHETLAGIGDKKIPGHIPLDEAAKERAALIIKAVEGEIKELQQAGPLTEDLTLRVAITLATEMALGLRPVLEERGEQ
ncbi:MAG: hypothetical protein V4702_02870 [Patescibacteria group bacterium]